MQKIPPIHLSRFSFCLLLTAHCLLFSCGGGLTGEQRKKIKEEMETSQIKKITEAEITEEVLKQGRQLVKALSAANTDSLGKAAKAKIKFLTPSQGNMSEIEKQLIDAYLSGLTGGSMDNVQKVGTDSLLYTVPVVEKKADGSEETKGIWSLTFSRKQIVLGL